MNDLVTTLLSAILGALAAGLFGIILEKNRRHREMIGIANAFSGEVKALLEKIIRRKYIPILRQAEKDKKLVQIDAKQNYFEVYESNCQQIGILPAEMTFEIAKFYIFAKAFVEDTNSYCSHTGEHSENSANYSEMAELLEEIINIGNSIAAKVETMNNQERQRLNIF